MKINPQNGASDKFLPSEASLFFDQLPSDHYDKDLDLEIHTDKTPVKFVPCTICQRAMVVTTFYVPAWAKCHDCGGQKPADHRGTVAVAQSGRTPPELAKRLADCLINSQFAEAFCPLNPGHDMELKMVQHNQVHGPKFFVGYVDGKPVYDNVPGETVIHQCLECRAVVTYSTIYESQLRRQNEKRDTNGSAPATWILGVREDA